MTSSSTLTTAAAAWVAPTPPNEVERLEALTQFNILDTPKDHMYDIVCDLATKALNCSTAAVSFIDNDRQWFKATLGLAVSELPRHVSLCTHALVSNSPIVVPDTLMDKRFAANPLVTQANVRFYAAAPITTPTGLVIGTVCGFDDTPREDINDAGCDIAALTNLAAAVLDHLDRAAYYLDDPWLQAQRQSTLSCYPKWTLADAHHFFASRKLLNSGSCDDVCALENSEVSDDEHRLDMLNSYKIMDTPADDFFENICGEATVAYGCPIAAVSFMDDTRQWFKASVGLGLTEIPRTISLCDTVSPLPTVVLDTLHDNRLVHNPFVNGTPRIRFYASAPLVSPNGYVIGSVFVLDVVPRTEFSTAPLVAFANRTMEHLADKLASDPVDA
ncbi:hypothetical protein H310_01204 [Aphanomyces invadans]|uniref:GAF domain-containing protein n=1 Tax=Aphanomyces invadans TaxID=157072 RepID=A0A024UQU4_9STRA|nr:hypothetical protein H310_01204 [Aphanomyces invadans]ETW08674.1 hypothetical protein H310_01204 [Aphanomyces invadans]|eukprot:XP_008862479.1 hypothetical protein H310_01204 [Aphanomyces invadans]